MIEGFVDGFMELWNEFFSYKMGNFFGKAAMAILVVYALCAPIALIPKIDSWMERRKARKGQS